MEVLRLEDMKGGWFIGDFAPSILQTKDFEVGIKTHKKGEFWHPHYHKELREINVLVSGSLRVQGKILGPNDIFIFEKGEISDSEFLEDCTIVIIKLPSIPGDKILVDPK